MIALQMFGLTVVAIMVVGAVASWADRGERRLMGLAAGFAMSVIVIISWGLISGSLSRIAPANVPDADLDGAPRLP